LYLYESHIVYINKTLFNRNKTHNKAAPYFFILYFFLLLTLFITRYEILYLYLVENFMFNLNQNKCKFYLNMKNSTYRNKRILYIYYVSTLFISHFDMSSIIYQLVTKSKLYC